MKKWQGKSREFPLDERVFVFPIVVFWKEAENNYYENWHSHFEIEEPTD